MEIEGSEHKLNGSSQMKAKEEKKGQVNDKKNVKEGGREKLKKKFLMTFQVTPGSANRFFKMKITLLCLTLFQKRKKYLLNYHLLYPIKWVRLHHLLPHLFHKTGRRGRQAIKLSKILRKLPPHSLCLPTFQNLTTLHPLSLPTF
jgi:hypothetical protein